MPKCIKHTCKDCIHFKICNDYVYLIGREDKVACPDFKATEDAVPRSEVVEEVLSKVKELVKEYMLDKGLYLATLKHALNYAEKIIKGAE